MRVPHARLISLVIVLFLETTLPAAEDELRLSGPSQQARRVYDQMVAAYDKLQVYTDHGHLQIDFREVRPDGKGKSSEVKAKAQVTFARPNRLALTFGDLRVVSNGTDVFTAIDSFKRYTVTPAPATVRADTFAEGWLGELLGPAPEGTEVQIILSLLLGTADDGNRDESMATHLMLGEQRIVEGRACDCLEIGGERDKPPRLLGGKMAVQRLLIDAETKLVRGIETEVPLPRVFFSPIPPPPPELPAGVEGVVVEGPDISNVAMVPYRWRWYSGAIGTTAPRDDAFRFTPPLGYVRAPSFKNLFEMSKPEIPVKPLRNRGVGPLTEMPQR